MFTSLIISGLIIVFALLANRALKKTDKPNGVQNVAEFIVESFFHFCQTITGDLKKAQTFMPLVATLFIFIILNNWSGLIPGVGYIFVPLAQKPTSTATYSVPKAMATSSDSIENTNIMLIDESAVEIAPTEGAETTVVDSTDGDEISDEHATQKMAPLFRAGTADLNTTLALSLISVTMIQLFGLRFQGISYLTKYFNFSSPINFFVGFLEIVSEFGKIASFAFRLFGNIFAGEVLILVLLYLTKVVAPIPFYGLELFVGMIQAVVFSMLSLILFNMATIGHHEEQ